MRKKELFVAFALCSAIGSSIITPSYAEPTYSTEKAEQETEDLSENQKDRQTMLLAQENNTDLSEDLKDDDFEDLDVDEDSESILDVNVEELVDDVKTKDDLEKANYIEYQTTPSKENLKLGDVMVDADGKLYIYGNEENEDANSWWEITEEGIVNTDTDIYNAENGFYYHEKETPLVVYIPPIETTYGTNLDDLQLPKGYTWVAKDVVLNKLEEREYKVLYTPENTLKYTTAQTVVVVKVQKIKKETPTIPSAKYIISYYDGITLKDIALPSGWIWSEDTALDVGNASYKAVYDKKEQYEYTNSTEMNVEVEVEKNAFRIQEVMITVNEGTKLTNEMLPLFDEGHLEWEEAGKEVKGKTNAFCKFIPNDSNHYDNTEKINVVINVVPKTVIKPTDTNNNQGKTDNSQSGTTQNGNTGNNSGNTQGNTSSNRNTDGIKQNGVTDETKKNLGVNSNTSSSNNTQNNNQNNTQGNSQNNAQNNVQNNNTQNNNQNSNQNNNQVSSNNTNSSKTNNENTTPNISDYKQNKDQNSSNGSNAQDNSNKQDNETSLPNLNLTSKKDQAKQNDEYYSETPSGITNHTTSVSTTTNQYGETQLPKISLLNKTSHSKDDSSKGDGEKTTEEKTNAVVGDILEGQEESTEETTEEEVKEEPQQKKKVDPFGMIALVGGVGAGGYLGFKKLRKKNSRR